MDEEFRKLVNKHMEENYPDAVKKPVVSSMKRFAIHIPEQTVYTHVNTLEEAEDIARYEYGNLHDDIKEVEEEKESN